jgi:hypothetical protein
MSGAREVKMRRGLGKWAAMAVISLLAALAVIAALTLAGLPAPGGQWLGRPVMSAVQTYRPQSAEVKQQDVSLSVPAVSQAADQTAVGYRLSWPDPCWRFAGWVFPPGPVLADESGTPVRLLPSPGAEAVAASTPPVAGGCDPKASGAAAAGGAPSQKAEGVLRFAPLPGVTRSASLTGAELEFDVQTAAGFDLDLGPDPQVGDAWPLDARVDVAGLSLRFNYVRLQRRNEGPSAMSPLRYALDFDVSVAPDPARRLLQVPVLRIAGAEGQQSFEVGAGSGQNQARVYFVDLPRGKITVSIDHAELILRGPWSVTWDTPASGSR